jgi:squalene-hopene/tetraprenyl-beta-curcumene cyclase
VVNEHEAYCQPCLSPVWDTALAAHTLLEVGGKECERRTLSSLQWLLPLRELEIVGDWAARVPAFGRAAGPSNMPIRTSRSR